MIIVSLIILIVTYFVWRYYANKRPSQFRSPPKVPILGHGYDLIFSPKGVLNVLLDYTEKYGETLPLEIGPFKKIFFTSDYNLIELVLSSSQLLKKSPDYRHLDRWLLDGLLTSDGDAKWKKHRRILVPAFNNVILEKFVGTFEYNGRILVKKLKENVQNNSIDISRFMSLCSLDIICETAMGTSVNAQEFEESDYVYSVKEMCRIIIERAFSPWKYYDFFYRFSSDYNKEKRALKIMHGFSQNVIQAKLNQRKNVAVENTEKMALLDILLNEMERQSLSFEDIRQEVDTFMFAGHDTTATAMNFAVFCLADNPEVQEKALQEQREIFSDDFQRPLVFDDLKKMKYLELVIKETLRLFPSVPFYARKVDQEFVYNGEVIPVGASITLFPFALHRNPKYYSEPLKFDPSRFESSGSKKLKYSYLPFSAGLRNCIGQNYAMLEMKAILSILLRNFKISHTVPKHVLMLSSQTVLISTNGVCVNLETRRVV